MLFVCFLRLKLPERNLRVGDRQTESLAEDRSTVLLNRLIGYSTGASSSCLVFRYVGLVAIVSLPRTDVIEFGNRNHKDWPRSVDCSLLSVPDLLGRILYSKTLPEVPV